MTIRAGGGLGEARVVRHLNDACSFFSVKSVRRRFASSRRIPPTLPRSTSAPLQQAEGGL